MRSLKMMVAALSLACLGLVFNHCNAIPAENKVTDDDEDLYRLPEGFLLGAGSSSYQVEGAWDQDGKSESVLDHTFHKSDIPNGDTAADHYHRFKEDIALLAKMKLNVYRFSISWGRIFPNGRRSSLEPRGVQHYHDVIDELLKYNIQPLITMCHYDFPQALKTEFSGWYSSEMIDVFADYADFLFSEYGDKVKYWNTLNEPNGHCKFMPSLPNARISGDFYYFNCLHHEILGHSRAYRIYQEKYAAKQKGFVGIGSVSFFARPNSTEYDDLAASQRANTFDLGMLLHPLVHGDYPPLARRILDGKANATHPSILPVFTEEQRKIVHGANDFIGINAYGGFFVKDRATMAKEVEEANDNPPSSPDLAADPLTDVDGLVGASDINVTVIRSELYASWLLGDIAMWVNDNYGKGVGVFITENGMPHVETINDYSLRAAYVSANLRNLLKATNRYNLNVMGYSYWSFLDSFEFLEGYEANMGLVKVDYAGKTLNRTLRDSGKFFEQVMTTRKVPLVTNGSDVGVAPFAFLICTLSVSTLFRLFF